MRVLVTGAPVPYCSTMIVSNDTGRECSKCGEFKPWSEFWRKSNGFKGRAAECKSCRSVYDKARQESGERAAYTREWRARRDPETKWREQVRHKYGVTDEWIDQKLEESDGLCMACGQPETDIAWGKVRRLSLDHCHESGRARGLLCNPCNRAIGYARDDAERLEACAAYLRKWSASEC